MNDTYRKTAGKLCKCQVISQPIAKYEQLNVGNCNSLLSTRKLYSMSLSLIHANWFITSPLLQKHINRGLERAKVYPKLLN